MAENNYIVPRFDNQSSWAAYNQENQRLQRKKKWGTVFNNMAGIMDPNHISSGKKAENDKRINNFSTSGMTGLMQQMKLMKAAEKEQIDRELNSRLLTEMPNLKSASDFNQWFQSQGPYVSPYYKTLFSTWAAGQSENRSAIGESRSQMKHEKDVILPIYASRKVNELMIQHRVQYQQAVAAGTGIEYLESMFDEVDGLVEAGELDADVAYLVKEGLSKKSSARTDRADKLTQISARAAEKQRKLDEVEQKKTAKSTMGRYAGSIVKQFNALDPKERTADALSSLISQDMAGTDLSNPWVTYKALSEMVTARLGTPGEARAKINQLFTVSDRIKNKVLEEAAVVFHSGDMRAVQSVVSAVLKEGTPQARLALYNELKPGLIERITETVYGDNPALSTKRMQSVSTILDESLGTAVQMQDAVTKQEVVRRGNQEWLWKLEGKLYDNNERLDEGKWSDLLKGIPNVISRDDYNSKYDDLQTELRKDLYGLDADQIEEALTTFRNSVPARFTTVREEKVGLIGQMTQEFSNELKPERYKQGGVVDLDHLEDNIDAVWRSLDREIVGRNLYLTEYNIMGKARRTVVNDDMWHILRLSYDRPQWNEAMKLLKDDVKQISDSGLEMTKEDAEAISASLRSKGYVIPAELIAFRHNDKMWLANYVERDK